MEAWGRGWVGVAGLHSPTFYTVVVFYTVPKEAEGNLGRRLATCKYCTLSRVPPGEESTRVLTPSLDFVEGKVRPLPLPAPPLLLHLEETWLLLKSTCHSQPFSGYLQVAGPTLLYST